MRNDDKIRFVDSRKHFYECDEYFRFDFSWFVNSCQIACLEFLVFLEITKIYLKILPKLGVVIFETVELDFEV